ncbi:MAG: hypothetical protein GEU99_13115 [Luteitalea sp.]|nr:hypothetical protein [Luteitalea sp.]
MTDRQPADEDLMLAYQRGDREVFDELYARYAKPIYNFFRRTALDDGTAEAHAERDAGHEGHRPLPHTVDKEAGEGRHDQRRDSRRGE